MAKHQAATAPLDVMQFVKRHMGNPHWRFDSPGGQIYTAEEVSAIILKRVNQDAELALGAEVADAVITVPASSTTPAAPPPSTPARSPASTR